MLIVTPAAGVLGTPVDLIDHLTLCKLHRMTKKIDSEHGSSSGRPSI